MSFGDRIEGERAGGQSLAGRTTTARLYRMVALGLLGCATAGVVAWYVTHIRYGLAAVPSARSLARGAATSEMKLPPLDASPQRTTPAAHESGADGAGRIVIPPAAQGGAAPHADQFAEVPMPVYGHLQRGRDVSPVLLRHDVPLPAVASTVAPEPPWVADLPAAELAEVTGRVRPVRAEPRVVGTIDAEILPDRRFLLPKGSFLDCTLETAIDSTLPGLATCVLAADVYGADGRVVLMERGTRLIGEAKSDVRSGQSRVAVIWDDARTPAGVRLALASAGTDALGRAGVPGIVDRHLGDRFGAAVMLSFVDAGANAVTARHQATGGIIYNPQASRDIATEALRGSIGIPPTVRVEPGSRIQVVVAADVNFRSVYRLVGHDPG